MSLQPHDSPVSIDLPSLIALRHRLHGSKAQLTRHFAATEGNYLTRFRGRGMAFAEVRAYQDGDDVRTIDWRVTARRGKVHTKLFQEERERPVILAIDYRRPMFFATRGCFKAVQVSRLAALLAWQALEGGDRVGAFIFSEQQHHELRPQAGKGAVLRLLSQLVENSAWKRPPHRPFDPQQRLAETVQRLHRVARPGSHIVVLSDFAQWDQSVEKQLAQLVRHCDLSLIHCYDPLEKALPPAGSYRVSNGVSDLTIATDQQDGDHKYRQAFASYCRRLENCARQYRCRYLGLQTCDDPLGLLQGEGGRG